MAQLNAGAAGANGTVPQADGAAVADGAVPLVNGSVLVQMDGARVREAGQAAARVAGALVAPVAVALLPQGLVHARFDVDGVLLGPLPTKSNTSCKILPKLLVKPGLELLCSEVKLSLVFEKKKKKFKSFLLRIIIVVGLDISVSVLSSSCMHGLKLHGKANCIRRRVRWGGSYKLLVLKCEGYIHQPELL